MSEKATDAMRAISKAAREAAQKESKALIALGRAFTQAVEAARGSRP